MHIQNLLSHSDHQTSYHTQFDIFIYNPHKDEPITSNQMDPNKRYHDQIIHFLYKRYFRGNPYLLASLEEKT